MPASTDSPRLLFVAEAVTLAHVARPAALATALAERGFEVHLARHPRYDALLGQAGFSLHTITSVSSQRFTEALARGRPLYDDDTLEAYVEEDLRLFSELRPDIVIGDFRLSLAVSAELAGVPYIALSNAYWSPYCRQRYPVPDLPLTRMLGPCLGQIVFSLARPFAFAMHCRPMARVRRRHGLPGLGRDLRTVFTHADLTLYADIPDLYQLRGLPASHQFIGPVHWSPQCPLPTWWHDVPGEKPVVYVTLGSSGDAGLLPEVLHGLGNLDVVALVSTAGADPPSAAPPNAYIAPFLPGKEAVKRAQLVICNGGSPGAHQALARGVPVLGVAGNLDQYLNMATVQRAGAGLCLRGGCLVATGVRDAVNQVLSRSDYRVAAEDIARRFRQYDAPRRLIAAVGALLAGRVRTGQS